MRFRWFVSWIVAFPLFKLLTGVEISGAIPRKGSYIIACNHVSFLDPPTVGITACREVYFLAKTGLFQESKFFTWLISSYNALPISGMQGLRTALNLLKKGNVVVIFPEGTRSKKGYMLPFNPGVSYLSITLGVPVIPAYISNSDKMFVSLTLRLNRLKIKFGTPILPIGYEKKENDLKRFASKIREEVMRLQ